MPANIHNIKETKLWTSSGWKDLPSGYQHLDKAREQRFLQSLLTEANSKHALDLCTSPLLDRAIGAGNGVFMQCKFAVVGGPTAGLLANALKETGVEVAAVVAKNWRVTASGIKAMVNKVELMLSQVSPEIIIFNCLEETLLCGVQDEGVVFPRMDTTGKLHLLGAAKILNKESQFEVFQELIPLLRCVGSRTILFMVPYKRWVSAKCCSTVGHLTNFEGGEWISSYSDKLEETARHFKSFFFTKNFRNVTIINPDIAARDLPLLSLWDSDPIIPSPLYFKKMAQYIISKSTGKELQAQAPTPPQGNRKRPRVALEPSNQPQPQPSTIYWSSNRGGRGGQAGRGSYYNSRDHHHHPGHQPGYGRGAFYGGY